MSRDLDIPGVPVPKPVVPKRFFLAHAKNVDEDALETWTAALAQILDRFSRGQPYDLVLGRAYFEARFKACGSWEAWANEIATGVDFATRRPLFDAIFVPATLIGAATARIIEQASGIRPLFAYTTDGRWAPIHGIQRVNRADYKTGSRLILAKPLAN